MILIYVKVEVHSGAGYEYTQRAPRRWQTWKNNRHLVSDYNINKMENGLRL